jgi:NAD(P)H dehydrogenase (quinone)
VIDPVKVSVIYYSATGTLTELARTLAEEAEKAGAEVRLRRVAELASDTAIDANPVWRANVDAAQDISEVSPDDVIWADAVLFGTPTRFGNVSAQLKLFIDSLGGLWQQGLLKDKVYSGFMASSTPHGGQESTLLALYNSIHHWGGIVVTPGYTDPSKFVDGNPYGTGHVSAKGTNPVDDTARTAATVQAKRVVTVAGALRDSLARDLRRVS